MGFLNKLLGSVDSDLMTNGILARGEIVGFTASGSTLSIGNGLVERKCDFTVKVYLDKQAPFNANCTQRVQEVNIPAIASGSLGPVAVRVDPTDHSTIAIDFATPAPEVTLAKMEGHDSAAWVLANGKPAVAVFVSSEPMGIKSSLGDEVYALNLTLAEGVDTPYQVKVGNGVPATSLPLLFPGNRLHVKIGDGPNDVVVDWSAGAVKA